ncbi:DUF5677 domain-containing protein [Streptomyces lushanensis]|uniref:DUF5677 domain-containing protein n=1 Tax=Streptomyces lushanensis TaxID=1434255 RepID=UPI00114CA7C8|nr:DUF5677 domain-containing protein [Streptomyces lushanensis]
MKSKNEVHRDRTGAAIETLATPVCLIGDDGNGDRFDQYVMNSLVAERELLADVQKNVERRDGEVWPIEERMKRSIAKTAKAAGIEDVSKLPGRARIGYPSTEARIKLLGPNAYLAYRMGSVEVHGEWNGLYRNHSPLEGLQFSPNVNGLHVRPQIPLTLVMLSLTVILENIEMPHSRKGSYSGTPITNRGSAAARKQGR